MNQVHIHLLITHLPIFGSLLGLIVLLYAKACKNTTTEGAAYLVMILAAVGGVIAYLTGEGAEHVARNIDGISKHSIHEHEEAGEFAFICILLMGISSIVSWYLNSLQSKFAKLSSMVVLAIGLLCFIATARAGFLGGQIRHPEMNSAQCNAMQLERQEEEHD